MEYERYDPEKHGSLMGRASKGTWTELLLAAMDGPIVFSSAMSDASTRNGIGHAARAKGLKAHIFRMGDSRYCLSVDAQ